MSEKSKTILLIFLIALLGGATGTFSKMALKEVSPIIFTLLRFVFAFIVLFPFILKERADFLKNKKRLVFISLFATGNVVFFVFGLQFTTAAISQMLYAAGPLIAGVFSYFIVKEKVGIKKVLGIIIGFLGTLIIVMGPAINSGSVRSGSILGNFIILIAVMSFSLYTVLSKKYEKEYSAFSLIKYFILTTIFTQIILIAFTETRSELFLFNKISTGVWCMIFYVGAVSTALYYLLYQYVIKRATPILASTILYLQPLFAILWASLLLGERVTAIFIAGGALIFIGLVLVFSQK